MITKIKADGGFTEYNIDDGHGAFFKIIPERGALVTSFCVDGSEAFFCERERLSDKNDIRAGGLPILFPICGQFDGGCSLSIAEHGFARTLPWSVTEAEKAADAITLELADSGSARRGYPFSFRCTARFALDDGLLCVSLVVENTGVGAMPFFAGFHPFFLVKDKSLLKLELNVNEEYTDCCDDQLKAYRGKVDFESPVDFVFMRKNKSEPEFAVISEEKRRLALEASGDYGCLVLWTEKNKPFVCAEPWMCPPDAMNTGKGLIILRRGERHESSIKIRL